MSRRLTATTHELGGSVDDAELVARVMEGDERAERALYDAHVERVFRLAHRMTGDEALAREFTQDTFVRVFDRIGQFRGEAALGTWIGAITGTVVLNGLRRVKRIREREVELDVVGAASSGSRQAEPDLKERLRSAIDALPDKYRMVFVMHDVEGYTHDEIAEVLGVRPGTSKAQLFRARARLRESLAAFAGEWAR